MQPASTHDRGVSPLTTARRLPRILGFFPALSLVVSSVLGTSIFLVPSTVAGQVPFVAGIAAVWLAGGLFSLAGALTYAELGAMLPEAGGGYVYLQKAFGPLASFLFVWTDFLIVRAGGAAAISVGFAAYTSGALPAAWPVAFREPAIAIALLLFLGLLNVLGTRLSGMVQVAGTVFKAGAIVFMIALPWLVADHRHAGALQPMWPARASWPVWQAMLAAMVPVLWAYGGWDQLSHMAEEVRDPDRNVPRAFGLGLALVSVLYTCAALAIQLVFAMPQVTHSHAIGSDYFRVLLGSPGVIFITAVVTFAGITAAHVALMSGSRSCFAIARGGLFPAWLGRVHPRFETPAPAIVTITAWACLLVAFNAIFKGGSRPLYAVLISYVMVGLLLFNGLIFAAAIRLRRIHPDWRRPYRAWGYPATPVVSIVVTVFLLITLLATVPWEAGSALAVILLGWPMYRRASRQR